MQELRKSGGIYLDMDVVTVNPLDDLLENEAVMGLQPGRGLCNAVMMFKSESKFLNEWYKKYEFFDKDEWDYLSVVVPKKMAEKKEYNIEIQSPYSFFYPNWRDPREILFSERMGISFLMKNIYPKGEGIISDIFRAKYPFRQYLITRIPFKLFHKKLLKRSYCIHLWQSEWTGEVEGISPRYIMNKDCNLSTVMRNVLNEDTISGKIKS
jgi:hypothetical protein